MFNSSVFQTVEDGCGFMAQHVLVQPGQDPGGRVAVDAAIEELQPSVRTTRRLEEVDELMVESALREAVSSRAPAFPGLEGGCRADGSGGHARNLIFHRRSLIGLNRDGSYTAGPPSVRLSGSLISEPSHPIVQGRELSSLCLTGQGHSGMKSQKKFCSPRSNRVVITCRAECKISSRDAHNDFHASSPKRFSFMKNGSLSNLRCTFGSKAQGPCPAS